MYIYLNTYMDIRTCGDINIYLYVVTRPEGVYHVCIFILILQIVAHEKTTVIPVFFEYTICKMMSIAIIF